MSDTTETRPFGAEVGRLLDLVVHALYSEREIFLRELVANAADATDRRRFEALTDPALAPPEGAKIRILPDREARTLTIEDCGIGMSREELADNLGTIARSGTRLFGERLAEAKPEDRPSLIGQFGVGFYSAFMVADRVEVTSRKLGAADAWTWASDGKGGFTLAAAAMDAPGTRVVLHIRADADEYLDPVRIETVVRKWADHIDIPVTIARDGKDVAANEGAALWRKPKAALAKADTDAFYRGLGNLFDTPWATIHWKAEGALDFAALLFIPGAKPFAPVEEERRSRVRLHVRRMFITDEAGLLPPWLRFVQGVIDTEDLPLNVSREMLQATPVLARIRRAATGRVLAELKARAKDAADYAPFWDTFGAVLKEGVWEDAEHRKEVAALLRFRSSAREGWVSLDEYVAAMKPGQEAIWLLAGEDPDALAASVQLEGFRAKGVEVLLLSDGIDAFWPERLGEYEGHRLRSITQGADLSKVAGGAPAGEAADVVRLSVLLKEALRDVVAEVRGTDRLTESAAVIAAASTGPDLMMARMLRRAGRMQEAPPVVLEINPRHPWIAALAARADAGGEVADDARLLLDLARVQDGDMPAHPADFARRVAALAAKA